MRTTRPLDPPRPDCLSDPATRSQYPPLLTPRQAAALLQVPVATIYDWSSRGVLDSCGAKVKVGRHLRLVRDRLLDCFAPEAAGGR